MTRENVYRGGERKRIVTVKGSTVSDRNEQLPRIAINRSIRNCFHAFTPSPDFFEEYILFNSIRRQDTAFNVFPFHSLLYSEFMLGLSDNRWGEASVCVKAYACSCQVYPIKWDAALAGHAGKEKAPRGNLLRLLSVGCWTTRIRTWTNRTKTCCATITP